MHLSPGESPGETGKNVSTFVKLLEIPVDLGRVSHPTKVSKKCTCNELPQLQEILIKGPTANILRSNMLSPLFLKGNNQKYYIET